MCDPIDGTCLHGCSPGWLGDTCHKSKYEVYFVLVLYNLIVLIIRYDQEWAP